MSAVSRFAAAFGLKVSDDKEKKEDDKDGKAARRAKARERKDDESDEDYAKRCAEEDEKDKAEDDKEKKDAVSPAASPAAVAPTADALAAARVEGVTAERKRWETTLSDPRAADRGIAACHMLAGTDMASGIILSTLATLPAQSAAHESDADGLARRMAAAAAANPAPSPGAGGGQDGDNSPTAMAARINAAADKARGKTK